MADVVIYGLQQSEVSESWFRTTTPCQRGGHEWGCMLIYQSVLQKTSYEMSADGKKETCSDG